jgi:SOS-response transcriptional repressor LexA
MENNKTYVQVSDDGMAGDRIFSGDLVSFGEVDSLNPDKIYLIIKESDVIARRILCYDKSYILLPSNPKSEPEIAEDITVLGQVTEVVVSV